MTHKEVEEQHMAAPKNHIRIIAPPSFRRTLSRRSFLSMGGAAGGLGLILAACGDDDDAGSTTSGQTGAATEPPGTTAGPGTTGATGHHRHAGDGRHDGARRRVQRGDQQGERRSVDVHLG